MIKKFVQILFLVLFVNGFAQTNPQWQGYFSYNKITDISQGQDKIYASSEIAIFSKNLATNDLATTTSVDGLKAETITAIHHSESFNKTLVGNKNGLLLVMNPDGKIVFKNGIVLEVPVSPFLKKINHFLEHNGKVYISCDYGISVFDLTSITCSKVASIKAYFGKILSSSCGFISFLCALDGRIVIGIGAAIQQYRSFFIGACICRYSVGIAGRYCHAQ